MSEVAAVAPHIPPRVSVPNIAMANERRDLPFTVADQNEPPDLRDDYYWVSPPRNPSDEYKPLSPGPLEGMSCLRNQQHHRESQISFCIAS